MLDDDALLTIAENLARLKLSPLLHLKIVVAVVAPLITPTSEASTSTAQGEKAVEPTRSKESRRTAKAPKGQIRRADGTVAAKGTVRGRRKGKPRPGVGITTTPPKMCRTKPRRRSRSPRGLGGWSAGPPRTSMKWRRSAASHPTRSGGRRTSLKSPPKGSTAAQASSSICPCRSTVSRRRRLRRPVEARLRHRRLACDHHLAQQLLGQLLQHFVMLGRQVRGALAKTRRNRTK